MAMMIFYFFALLSAFSAVMVVLAKSPVRAVLFLIFTFFNTAVMWLLLKSEFLAIILILVYVGAVMVLFLFVVMMLEAAHQGNLVRYWPLSLVVLLGSLLLLVKGITSYEWAVLPGVEYQSHVKALGMLLYRDYLLAFEVAGVILLVAMIAAIGLTFRGSRSKKQQVSAQVSVKKQDRLTILNMPAEKGTS